MPLHLVTGYAGQEHITSADQGSFNIAMMGSTSYVLDRGNKFSASIQTNNLVRVLDGDALMQGRHIRLVENTYTDVSFDNGTQGMKRNDLIVIRYTKNASTSVESASFVVIKGTPSSSTPTDPSYTIGDITEAGGALVADMPLYRVVFDGLTLTTVTPLFTTVKTWKNLQEDLEDEVDEAIIVMEARITAALANVPHIVIGNVPPATKAAALANGDVYIYLPDMP